MFLTKNKAVWLLAGVMSAALMPAAWADERLYFTSDRVSTPGKTQTQVFSMNADGSDVRQHTRSGGIKAHVYRCGEKGPIFYESEDALVRLGAHDKEETYLVAPGTQYHSPRCSSDARYLSVTAWDKKNETGYIEVYELASRRRVGRWEGEEASWKRGSHALIYKLLVPHGEGGRIDILLRDIDKPAAAAKELYRYEVGEYVYNITQPQLVGPGEHDFVFRVYDEHEYYYYIGEVGKSFVLTRGKAALEHHNVYAGEYGTPLEQDQLTLSPDGKYGVFTEHPWNAPPSLYLLDLRTRDSWKIAEGFNPVWAEDSRRIYFNKDPAHYERYRDALKRDEEFKDVYPKSLDGYEIYVYDLASKQEKRLTNNQVYDGFL